MVNLLRNMSASGFNRRFPVGSKFRYYPVPGLPGYEEVITRSTAWHMQRGNNLVVRVEGKIGGVSVNHLEPIV